MDVRGRAIAVDLDGNSGASFVVSGLEDCAVGSFSVETHHQEPTIEQLSEPVLCNQDEKQENTIKKRKKKKRKLVSQFSFCFGDQEKGNKLRWPSSSSHSSSVFCTTIVVLLLLDYKEESGSVSERKKRKKKDKQRRQGCSQG